MTIRVTCPSCKKKIGAPESMAGKQGKCPHCGAKFLIPAQARGAPAGSSLDGSAVARRQAETSPRRPTSVGESTAVPSPAPQAAAEAPFSYIVGAASDLALPCAPQPATQGRTPDLDSRVAPQPAIQFALLHRIHLGEHAPAKFESQEDAEKAMTQLKSEMPLRPSAYVPSGETPAPALLWMLGGALLGIPAGTVGACVGLLIGGLVCALVGGLAAATSLCIFWCLLVVCAVLTFGAQWTLAGIVSAWTIVSMGKLGKNRNPFIPIPFSIVSAAVAVVVFMHLLGHIGSRIAAAGKEVPQSVSEAFTNSGLFWTLTGIGVVIAAIAAGAFANHLVCEARFCETCNLYMRSVKLKPVSLSGLRVLIKAFDAGNMEAVVGMYEIDQGSDGSSDLFSCPRCRSGYLDVSVAFQSQYTDKEGQTHTLGFQWRVGSRKLTAEEVRRLRAFVQA